MFILFCLVSLGLLMNVCFCFVRFIFVTADLSEERLWSDSFLGLLVHFWFCFASFCFFSTRLSGPYPCRPMVNALGRHVQWSVTHLGDGVQSFIWVRSLSTKELFQSNSDAHDEQGVNPVQERRFDDVLYNLWLLLIPWLAASRVVSWTGISQSWKMWLATD